MLVEINILHKDFILDLFNVRRVLKWYTAADSKHYKWQFWSLSSSLLKPTHLHTTGLSV